MSIRQIINGSFEPLWRHNARRDADTFRRELQRGMPSRRALLAGAGSALMLEYVATRRAIALPRRGGADSVAPPSASGEITNARTSATYRYLPDALFDMATGDTLLLPAGTTYQYQGATYYYQNSLNTNWARYGFNPYRAMILGTGGFFGAGLTADYGTLQGTGTANNGRALIAPPYGFLAADFHTTDTEIYFDSSTPVTNFFAATTNNLNAGACTLWVSGACNRGQFVSIAIGYTGVDVANNRLTGVTGNTIGTIPAGAALCNWNYNGKGIIGIAGQTGAWTLTNIEAGYATCNSNSGEFAPVLMASCNPGGPYGGSVVCNNCYFHETRQGFGLGYAGGQGTGVHAHCFDTEFSQIGVNDSQTHNIYIGHIDELLLDNCYSHNTAGTWLVKSRAAMNILSNCQIRGERTDSNNNWGWGEIDNSGCDFSNGGLVYLIGNIHQQSLNAANQMIDFAAEAGVTNGTNELGGADPIQELYAVNCTFVGPVNGTGYSRNPSVGYAPIKLNNVYVHSPEVTLLSQSAGGSLPARQYWISNSIIGNGGGETNGSPIGFVSVGAQSINQTLSVSAGNLIQVASPTATRTGGTSWNCYANYSDPRIYTNIRLGSQSQEGNQWFWDSGCTQPIFSFTSGGRTISCTGTLTNGSSTITGVGGLAGIASFWQLYQLSLYVGGVATGLYVTSVDPIAGTVSLNGGYSGTTATSFTFGHFLYCGFTYQTSLGDSINTAIITVGDAYGYHVGQFYDLYQYQYGGNVWYDGAYATHSVSPYYFAATIQVPPGQKLIVNAPPSGPTWGALAGVTGINFWCMTVPWYVFLQFGLSGYTDAAIAGISKQNATPIAFGGSWTSPTWVYTKAQGNVAPQAGLVPNLFLQNSSPLALGTNFTEPNSVLQNNNPTATKLQWFRRGAQNINGATQDCWYAIVPNSGLASYTDTIWLNTASGSWNGAISIWRGVSGFDSNFPFPVSQPSSPVTVSTAAGNVSLLASFRSNTTVGSGITQITHGTFINAGYASFTAAQSSLSITETGGNAYDAVIVDALIGVTAAPTLISSVILSGSGGTINFTVSSANAGDMLYLQLGLSNVANVIAVGKVGTPPNPQAVGNSPTCLIQNCISVNFNSSSIGGSMAYNGDSAGVAPARLVTEITNLACNPFNGTTFGTPSFATVFADQDQNHFNYNLATGSPAKNAASNPGTSPRGQDLIPHYQVNWYGLNADGTPLPAKTARSDIGPGKTGSIGALP